MDKVRMAMVGGGEGAFIGNVHRMAARLDGRIELVAGAFNSDASVARRFGRSLGLPDDRSYGSWAELIGAESARPDGAEFVAIVTPNDSHLPIAKAALESGLHVLSDKPATRTLAEALELRAAAAGSGLRYALTLVYLGYPLVVEARQRVLAGEIGEVRRVAVHYTQGWLASALEAQGHKQAGWRTDPQRSGGGGSIADIGVHAFSLAEYVAGRPVSHVCGDLGHVVAGRQVDDDAAAFLRFDGGARGVLTASQVSTGEANELSVSVYGTEGAVSWRHSAPNSLTLLSASGDRRELRAGTDQSGLSAEARSLCRLPAGHPEGFIEAFANLYRTFADDVRSAPHGQPPRSPAQIDAGVRGMGFIAAMIASSATHPQWVPVAG